MKVKSNKEIIILRHNGGQLGNQLLLFASIYAYCLEKGFECTNLTFFEYSKFFNIRTTNFLTTVFERLSNLNFYKKHALIYLTYKYLSYLIPLFKMGKVVKSLNETTYLPPTLPINHPSKTIIQDLEHSIDSVIYLDGWNFRNPAGIKKYRQQIINKFRPKDEIIKKVQKFVEPLKAKYYLIGIHLRQADYKNKKFKTAGFYFAEREVADILRTYLKKKNLNTQKILFILCSDEPLDLSYFQGLKIKTGIGSMIEDLITLSMCNIIIGSNSTFGSFAAFFGNIPFFIFDHNKKYIRARGENLMQGL